MVIDGHIESVRVTNSAIGYTLVEVKIETGTSLVTVQFIANDPGDAKILTPGLHVTFSMPESDEISMDNFTVVENIQHKRTEPILKTAAQIAKEVMRESQPGYIAT